MIDFNLFNEKVDEWSQLTVLRTLQRDLKNKMYDRIRHFDQEAFDKAIEEVIEMASEPSYTVLRNAIQHYQKTNVTEPPESKKTTKEWCPEDQRECELCEVYYCTTMSTIIGAQIFRLLDDKTHDDALVTLKREFPAINWEYKHPKVLGCKKNKLGKWENVYAGD